MSPGLKPYPAYRDSGVEWLGQVPEHWEVLKLRQVLRQVAKRNRADLPLLSVVRERGVILRDVSSKDENHNFIPDDLSNYKVVRSGQFAMNKMKAWQGSYGVSGFDGIVSPAYFVFDLAGVAPDYFHTAIRSLAYVPFFTAASDGVRVGQWDLSPARMREIPFFEPPRAEQTLIVRYLDHMDRRIRRYICARQKLIKLLEEQKQVIIQQAVTGQIDTRTGKPCPAYKDSGVEWLGQVPSHWQVRCLRTLSAKPIANGIGESAQPYRDDWPRYVRITDIAGPRSLRTETRASLPPELACVAPLREGDLLIAAVGATYGKSYLYCGGAGPACFAGYLVRVTPHEAIRAEFLSYWTDSQCYWYQVNSNVIQSTIQNFSASRVKALRIAVPPLDEQDAIVCYLDHKTAKVIDAIAHAQREIDLLREYRARLISEVVTGKLDVRAAAASLPDEAEEPEELAEDELLAEENKVAPVEDDEVALEEVEI